MKPKKTKLEKIAELESALKLAKEENRGLKKELHVLKGVTDPTSRSQRTTGAGLSDMMETTKMKDALKALKKVTINQEMSLQSLRAKASQRRKELQEKDVIIIKLQKEVTSMRKALKTIEGGGNIRELQRAHFEAESKCMLLEDKLAESDLQLNALKKQLEINGSGSLRRTPSNHSLKSIESVTTVTEMDLSRMKKELATKGSRIIELENELEQIKDEMHEMKEKKMMTEAFGNDSFSIFANDPFHSVHETSRGKPGDDFYSDSEEEQDFW